MDMQNTGHDVVKLIKGLSGEKLTSDGTPALELMIALKRIEGACNLVRTRYRPKANLEFQELTKDLQKKDKKKIPVGTLGTVSGYSKASKWDYSDKVATMEAKLKKLKAKEQKEGTAKNIPPEFNPDLDAVFSVSADYADQPLPEYFESLWRILMDHTPSDYAETAACS